MKIMDILLRDAVVLNLASAAKEDVLGEMARAVAGAESSIDADVLLKVLQDHDRLSVVKGGLPV